MEMLLLAAVVLRLSNTDSPEKVQELATVARSVADIRQVSVNQAERSISFDGTAEQNAIAEWLVPKLDVSGPAPAGGPYTIAKDDMVRVFYLTHAATPQQVQEIVTTGRSLAEVRRAFVYEPAKAFVARGTADQIKLLEWLVPKLDVPGPQTGSPQHAVAPEDIARVFYVEHAKTPEELQQMSTVIRSIGDIMRAFVSKAARAVAMRATPDQQALAEFLFTRLDRPAGTLSPTSEEHRIIGVPDGVVRVFPADAEQAKNVRIATGIKRAFVYTPHRVVVMRGTPAQIAEAGRLLNAR